MRLLWPLSLLMLAACQPQDPTGTTATVPADAPVIASAPAPSDFSQPMTAIGTEPFWSLTVAGPKVKLSRPGEPDLIANAPGAAIKPGQATWVASGPGMPTLSVTFVISPCSDGMSERAYPMTAEVTLGGSPPLRGCADYGRSLKPN